jgi:transcriptional regulator with XRE-family HTH domain
MTWKKIIGERLRRLRLDKGMSSGELRNRSGVSCSMIEACEAGRYPLSLETAARLTSALDVRLAELLEGISFGSLTRKPVPLDVAVKLAHSLGVSLEELFALKS